MSYNVVTIDGLIGAGKSTVMMNLWDNHDIYIRLEPIENWKPYLERIYKYNDHYYEFQLKIWEDICCFKNIFSDNQVILERSPFFIRKTFIKNLLENNKISLQQYNHLLELHNQSDQIWKPKIMIYLKVSPEKALERIKIRNRDNENFINLEYLYQLYNLHEQAYHEAKQEGYNIVIVDADRDVKEIVQDILKIIGVDKQ